MLDIIKRSTKHMYHPQQIHWVVQVAISSSVRMWERIRVVSQIGFDPVRKLPSPVIFGLDQSLFGLLV